jgi:hypothetical protein
VTGKLLDRNITWNSKRSRYLGLCAQLMVFDKDGLETYGCHYNTPSLICQVRNYQGEKSL